MTVLLRFCKQWQIFIDYVISIVKGNGKYTYCDRLAKHALVHTEAHIINFRRTLCTY